MNKSNLFKQAHALTKATIQDGDSYSATFALCLKAVYAQLTTSPTTKLLITEEKGATFRALNLETNKELRIFQRDFPNVDLIVGSLLTVTDLEVGGGNLVMNMTVVDEILGDSTKDRIEVCIDDHKIGDLIDGVPILNFGVTYAKKGKKMAYAYFKNRR